MIISIKKNFGRLPAGYSALFRPRCWWSNSIKCVGSVKLTPCEYKEEIIANILKTVSRFDYVETNMGFFKYQQDQMHKSNIYSIKLTNTGLNPNTHTDIKFYEREDIIEKLKTPGQPTITNDYTGNGSEYKYVFNPKNNTFTVQSSINKPLGLSGLILSIDHLPKDGMTYTFNELTEQLGWIRTVINNNEVFYNKNEEGRLNEINIIKSQLRAELEINIKRIIKEFMPVETTLWKIIYDGK